MGLQIYLIVLLILFIFLIKYFAIDRLDLILFLIARVDEVVLFLLFDVTFLVKSQESNNLLVLRNSSGVLNAVKNKGVPAKDKGETGPTVIKAYCREDASKAL